MKKIFFALAFSSLLIACKKENSNPNSPVTKTPTTVEDTTKKTADSVSCVDNPKINFTCVGAPVGKLSYCIKDIDGNVYKTVVIGKQQWMAENLKVSKYNDGTVIPNVKDSLDWNKAELPYLSDYVNNTQNENYKVYNWYVVDSKANSGKNVCPNGWHVPSLEEWSVLIEFLGGEGLAGAKMKEVGMNHWLSTNKQTDNSSLFTALPSVYKDSYNLFSPSGFNCNWWTIDTFSGNYVNSISLNLYSDKVIKDLYLKNNGLSIRCIKD